MEIRVLRYFLAVAREESISTAAEYLHITQPTLSRQIMELEEQLGYKLLNRGKRNHKITLTDEGILLRNRAEEIITLIDKTETEFATNYETIHGDIYWQWRNRRYAFDCKNNPKSAKSLPAHSFSSF